MLAYELPPDQQTRLNELLEIDKTSRLTAAQREELGDYRFVEDVMTRVKLKIKQRLEQQNDNSGEANAESVSDAPEEEENES